MQENNTAIYISPSLRTAALNVANASEPLDKELILRSQMGELKFTFTTGETSRKAFESWNALHQFLEVRQWPVPAPSLSGETVNVATNLWQPSMFWEAIADCIQTGQHSLTFGSGYIELARLYGSAADRCDVVRVDPVDNDPENQSAEMYQCRAGLISLFEAFHSFADTVIQASESHLVHISKDGVILIDDQPVDLLPRPKRGILVFALLRESPGFDVEKFVRLYNDKPAEPRTEFHAVKIAVSKVLPRLRVKAANSRRQVSGIEWDVAASTVKLKKLLRMYYKS